MATASIRSYRNGLTPVENASRDDLEVGDLVAVQAASGLPSDVYAWSLAYIPPGSTSSLTGVLGPGPHSFPVDKEGPYLARLQLTDQTGTTEQFVRLRAITQFGRLSLVAAGERYDTVRVPVDISFEGWADEQNANSLKLLGLIQDLSVSTRTVFVDPTGSDATGSPFKTIQAAVAWALTQSPSASEPWVVVVRPGSYSENLFLYPWVHVVGDPSAPGSGGVKVLNASIASHTLVVTDPSSEVRLANLRFVQENVAAGAAVTSQGAGKVFAFGCGFISEGNTGAAFWAKSDAEFNGCSFTGGDTNPNDPALRVSGFEVSLQECRIEGQLGVLAEADSTVVVVDSDIVGSGSGAIETNADSFRLELSRVTGRVAANPSGIGTPAGKPLGLEILWSRVGAVEASGANVSSGATLTLGSTLHGAVAVTGGAVLKAGVPADTSFYDNALFAVKYPTSPAPSLTSENVQDALDELYNYASLVRTLDDAYDGGDPGPTGTGRSIVADAGSVQILGAATSGNPIPWRSSNGGLDVAGRVRIGGVEKPEITLDPNPFGNGPEIYLGYQIWANDAPFGSVSLIVGDASGAPNYRNYSLRLATRGDKGGDRVGSVYTRAGESYTNIDAGSVYLQAGSALDILGGQEGYLYLTPGESATGATGTVVLNRPDTATPASLVAAGPWVGGVAGAIFFGTEFGSVRVLLTGTETLSQTLTKLSASHYVTATESGGVITLTTTGKGETAEIFYLTADVGVNVSLGDFSLVGGAVFTPGTWPDQVDLSATANGELTIGRSGVSGPLVYNSQTGLLEVPGIVSDTTGIIFNESPAPGTGSLRGALFIADGSGGTNQNHPYYEADDGTLYDLLQGLEGAATIRKDFAFNSPNPVTITGLVPGDLVVQVFMRITTAFDDPSATVEVGTTTAPDLYFAGGDSDLTLLNSIYTVSTMEESPLVDSAVITVNPAGSTIGAGTVLIVVHRYGSIVTPSSTTSLMIAGEPIQKGDVVLAYYDVTFSQVRVKRADADAILLYERTAYGVAGSNVNTSDQVPVLTIPGVNTFLRFDTPPGSSSVGQPVFLSQTPGEVSLTAPTASGSSVYRVGFLYQHLGGSGVPVVTFQPQFIAAIP